MKKLELNFMVDPEYLAKKCRVPNKVKILITKPDSVLYKTILGESGRAMAHAGMPFYFEKGLAQGLIHQGVAKRLDK